ncbi:hypothetical protein IJI72_02440 [Candidatus Saccharibacteria bacterium]|nr:hypothetical protein [Candidatus Saccharibacteria bacterium]
MVVIRLNSGKALCIEGSVRDALLKPLTETAARLNRPPSFAEVLADPDLPPPNTYSFYYGSYAAAATAAYNAYRSGGLARDGSESAPENPAPRKRRKLMNHKRRNYWSKPLVLDCVKRYYEAHGKIPSTAEASADSTLPSYTTLKQHLGPHSTWLAQVLAVSETGSEIAPETTDTANESTEVAESTVYKLTAEAVEPEPSDLAAEITTDATVEVREASARETDDTTTIELKLQIPGHSRPVLLSVTF